MVVEIQGQSSSSRVRHPVTSFGCCTAARAGMASQFPNLLAADGRLSRDGEPAVAPADSASGLRTHAAYFGCQPHR